MASWQIATGSTSIVLMKMHHNGNKCTKTNRCTLRKIGDNQFDLRVQLDKGFRLGFEFFG